MATPSPEEIDAFLHMVNGSKDSRVGLILAVEIPLVIIMVAVVCLRFYARTRVSKALGKDDWIMGCATLIATANTTICCIATRYGAGVHAWNVHPDWIATGAQLGFWYQAWFVPSVALTKISICLTYLRIFPGKRDRIFCKTMIVYQSLSGVAIFFAMIFQCIPVSSFWDLTIHDKKCYNQKIGMQVASALNSLSDFAVFLWPAPNIWKIQLPVKQRLALMFVFTLGCVVCIAGIIRIWFYKVYFKSKDVFYSAAILYIVSDIECNLGIICGSLPEIRPLLSRWWTTTASTASNLTRFNSAPRSRPNISAPMPSPYNLHRTHSADSQLANVISQDTWAGKSQHYYSKGGNSLSSPSEKTQVLLRDLSNSPHSPPQAFYEAREHEMDRYSPRRMDRFDTRSQTSPIMERNDHRVSALSEDLGSEEMWIGVEKGHTRPAASALSR